MTIPPFDVYRRSIAHFVPLAEEMPHAWEAYYWGIQYRLRKQVTRIFQQVTGSLAEQVVFDLLRHTEEYEEIGRLGDCFDANCATILCREALAGLCNAGVLERHEATFRIDDMDDVGITEVSSFAYRSAAAARAEGGAP